MPFLFQMDVDWRSLRISRDVSERLKIKLTIYECRYYTLELNVFEQSFCLSLCACVILLVRQPPSICTMLIYLLLQWFLVLVCYKKPSSYTQNFPNKLIWIQYFILDRSLSPIVKSRRILNMQHSGWYDFQSPSPSVSIHYVYLTCLIVGLLLLLHFSFKYVMLNT